MVTVMAHATMCMIINAIAVGQFAPGMVERANPMSGKKEINKKQRQ
jgi:hypothetical protein